MRFVINIDNIEPILISLNRYDTNDYFEEGIVNNFDLLKVIIDTWLFEDNYSDVLKASYVNEFLKLGCLSKSLAKELADYIVKDYTISNTLRFNFRKIKRMIHVAENICDVTVDITDYHLIIEVSKHE